MAFIGSEALRSGRLTRGQLRWNYTAVHPNVYIPRGTRRTLAVNTRAAALWVPNGVVTGRAAAALHGARYVGDDTPIELIGRSRRAQPGVIVRSDRIARDEIIELSGLRVGTPARAALDISRHLPRGAALAHLDALAAATGLHTEDVLRIAERYPGARGVRQTRQLVPLLDAGAESPRESWLRLLVMDAGFPRPQTQIRVSDGCMTAYLDMGWEELRIGLEYDGDQHRSDRAQYVKDLARHEMFTHLDWLVIRVVKEHSRARVLHRVGEAFRLRGSTAVRARSA